MPVTASQEVTADWELPNIAMEHSKGSIAVAIVSNVNQPQEFVCQSASVTVHFLADTELMASHL